MGGLEHPAWFERGLATHLGRPGGNQGNPGADKWARFFAYAETHPKADDTKRRLWSEGEEASTRKGYDVARSKGTSPRINEAGLAYNAHVFRHGLGHMPGSRHVFGSALCGAAAAVAGCREGAGGMADAFFDVKQDHTSHYSALYFGTPGVLGGRLPAGPPGVVGALLGM